MFFKLSNAIASEIRPPLGVHGVCTQRVKPRSVAKGSLAPVIEDYGVRSRPLSTKLDERSNDFVF